MTSPSFVLVAGSANLDFVVRASRIPAPGETVLGRDFRTFPGGKGANQAVAAARAGGGQVRMLLALGEDSAAQVLEDSLRGASVDLDIRRQPTSPTGAAFICISDDAENAITVAPGANDALTPADLPPLDDVSHLLLQLETPLEAVTTWAAAARVAGVQVLLNAAPARGLPAALLDATDLLIVNEGELALLSGESSGVSAGLAKLGVPGVVVTLGARGCVARIDGELHVQPAFAVQAVDTTAAGDTFCGSLAARLAQGDGIDAALRYASAASAIACTRLGAQSSIPERGEVEAFLRDAPPFAPQAQQSLAAYCGL